MNCTSKKFIDIEDWSLAQFGSEISLAFEEVPEKIKTHIFTENQKVLATLYRNCSSIETDIRCKNELSKTDRQLKLLFGAILAVLVSQIIKYPQEVGLPVLQCVAIYAYLMYLNPTDNANKNDVFSFNFGSKLKRSYLKDKVTYNKIMMLHTLSLSHRSYLSKLPKEIINLISKLTMEILNSKRYNIKL